MKNAIALSMMFVGSAVHTVDAGQCYNSGGKCTNLDGKKEDYDPYDYVYKQWPVFFGTAKKMYCPTANSWYPCKCQIKSNPDCWKSQNTYIPFVLSIIFNQQKLITSLNSTIYTLILFCIQACMWNFVLI